MKKFIVIVCLLFMAFGCKTMEKGVMTVKHVPQNMQDSIETGIYLKDEGVLGFFWYAKMTKLPNGEEVSKGYVFSFLNLGLLIMTIIVISHIRFKKEPNIYSQDSPLEKDIVAPSTFFRRGMRLFILLTLATALIITYCVVVSHHVLIDTISISSIIISMVIYALFVYVYWYFMLKYTDIYIKQSMDHDDMIVSSKHGALILAVLLVVILTWFVVIGILSGLFIPLLGLLGAIILVFMLKERTWCMQVLF